MSEKNIGSVVQVTGPVLDIRFPEGSLPALLCSTPSSWTTTAPVWWPRWRSRSAITWCAASP